MHHSCCRASLLLINVLRLLLHGMLSAYILLVRAHTSLSIGRACMMVTASGLKLSRCPPTSVFLKCLDLGRHICWDLAQNLKETFFLSVLRAGLLMITCKTKGYMSNRCSCMQCFMYGAPYAIERSHAPAQAATDGFMNISSCMSLSDIAVAVDTLAREAATAGRI